MEDKPETQEQYENEQGEVLEAEVPQEGEHSKKREFNFKIKGYNNNSGIYYLNSGLAQYEGEERFALNSFSSAKYINEKNKGIFKDIPIGEKSIGSEELPIPDGFELRGGRDSLNRPALSQKIISDSSLKDNEEINDETN